MNFYRIAAIIFLVISGILLLTGDTKIDDIAAVKQLVRFWGALLLATSFGIMAMIRDIDAP